MHVSFRSGLTVLIKSIEYHPAHQQATPTHPAAVGRQANSAPPVPGLPDNTDSTQRTSRATAAVPDPPGPPQLTASYLPAVMQAVAYYVDLLQYEIVDMTTVEPPFTLPQDDPTASTTTPSGNAPTSKIPVTTTPRPPAMTTTTAAASSSVVRPTVAHAPGYYAPFVAAPPPTPVSPVDASGSVDTAATSADRNRPQMGTLPLLSISNQQFFNWFLQSKDEKVSQQSGECPPPLREHSLTDTRTHTHTRSAIYQIFQSALE